MKKEEIIQGTLDLRHPTDFYKDLFCPATGFACYLRYDIWENREKLNEEDITKPDKIFSEEELKRVIDSMEKSHAPGLDEIPY